MSKVDRHKTAVARVDFSRPVRLALDTGILSPDSTVLDYGCGRGDDVRGLKAKGISATGWDPVHSPETALTEADVVNLGYVLN